MFHWHVKFLSLYPTAQINERIPFLLALFSLLQGRLLLVVGQDHWGVLWREVHGLPALVAAAVAVEIDPTHNQHAYPDDAGDDRERDEDFIQQSPSSSGVVLPKVVDVVGHSL